MASEPLYGFSQSAAGRLVKATKWFEANGMRLGGDSQARDAGDLQCIFAKLTSKSGTLYAWSQAWPSAADGSWSTKTGGKPLSGTTSSYPAILLDASDTSDHTNKYAVLVGAIGSNGKRCWVIAGFAGGGYSGTVNVVTDVSWDGTALKETKTPLTFSGGLLTTVGSTTTSTIDTPTVCT